MQKGNQHGGRKFNDLQNGLDVTSHENPLYDTDIVKSWLFTEILCILMFEMKVAIMRDK